MRVCLIFSMSVSVGLMFRMWIRLNFSVIDLYVCVKELASMYIFQYVSVVGWIDV